MDLRPTTVQLTEEQHVWLERKAQSIGSKAAVMRMAIDQLRDAHDTPISRRASSPVGASSSSDDDDEEGGRTQSESSEKGSAVRAPSVEDLETIQSHGGADAPHGGTNGSRTESGESGDSGSFWEGW